MRITPMRLPYINIYKVDILVYVYNIYTHTHMSAAPSPFSSMSGNLRKASRSFTCIGALPCGLEASLVRCP